jgi:signal transduction histidine kinase
MLTAVSGIAVVFLGMAFIGRPLNRLVEKTRRVGTGDLSGPVVWERHDEMGELARALNDMCVHLAEVREHLLAETEARIRAVQQLRHADRLTTVGRLAAGMAHELGTPLNVAAARADMICEDTAKSDVAGSARIVKNQIDKITKIVRQLLESELFGHEKGAFTDASSARDGLFVQADGGSLLLDEIADLPLNLQPKLLRALEERRVRPIGSNRERSFDVRLLAATNSDLEIAKDAGRFREDLYYRLHVIPVELPPLRSRGTDVLLIARHFTEQFSQRFGKHVTKIADPAAKFLLAYDWPGNVRELRNAMERAVGVDHNSGQCRHWLQG